FPRGAEAAVKGQAPLLFQQPHPGFQFLVASLQRLAVALPIVEVIAKRPFHTPNIRCLEANSFESLAQIARLLTGLRVICPHGISPGDGLPAAPGTTRPAASGAGGG